MATITRRGNTYSVKFTYKGDEGQTVQHWESYNTELEATQRKAHIDFLQKIKDNNAIVRLALEYRQKRAEEKEAATVQVTAEPPAQAAEQDNLTKTFREFFQTWLPVHARKKRLSPNTLDSYMHLWETHIETYLGGRVMSEITSRDIDDFVDHLSQKQCRGTKRYSMTREEIPTLASATVRKVFNLVKTAFMTAVEWGYARSMPNTQAPTVKHKKRPFWSPQDVYMALDGMQTPGEEILHLAIHMAFICSLRAGELMGIGVKSVDFRDNTIWITQSLQRVSDEALAMLPAHEVIRRFPKLTDFSKSMLILKPPKTEDSTRKQYLTAPLVMEIKARIAQIEHDKEYYGEEYHDYGLLFSWPNGDPIEPTRIEKWFRTWQADNGIEDTIDIQGLRKSGQMHKVRLSGFDYQLVAQNSGQSPEVLMTHYNEVLEYEKKNLAMKIEDDFYPKPETTADVEAEPKVEKLMEQVLGDPALLAKLTFAMRNMRVTQP